MNGESCNFGPRPYSGPDPNSDVQHASEIIPGSKDKEYFLSVVNEVHRKFYPRVRYYPLKIEEEVIDNLYWESRESVYGSYIEINAFVDWEVERRRLLTVFGKDEERDLIIWVSSKTIKDMGLNIKSGDVFIIDGKEFKVMDESLKSHVMNQNLYLELGYSTKMRRESSLSDRRIDTDLVPPPDYESGDYSDPIKPFDYDFPK